MSCNLNALYRRYKSINVLFVRQVCILRWLVGEEITSHTKCQPLDCRRIFIGSQVICGNGLIVSFFLAIDTMFAKELGTIAAKDSCLV